MTLLSEDLEVYHAAVGSSSEEGCDSAKTNPVSVLQWWNRRVELSRCEVETLKDGGWAAKRWERRFL